MVFISSPAKCDAALDRPTQRAGPASLSPMRLVPDVCTGSDALMVTKGAVPTMLTGAKSLSAS
jgi:hypothetical protein